MSIPDQLLRPEVIGPLVTTPAAFFTIFASIALVLWFRARSERARHEMLTLLVEKGQPVPPELFARARKPASDLRRGVVLIALGIGVFLALVVFGAERVAGLGIIPALTGVGYLVVWRIESKGRQES